MFWKVSSEHFPTLDFFNGDKYFVCIDYEQVIGDTNPHPPFQSYSAGYLVIKKDPITKEKSLKYYPDTKAFWTLHNGYLSFNENDLSFEKVSQLLLPFNTELNVSFKREEELFDNFLTKFSIPIELAFLYFLSKNIPFKGFSSPPIWTYSSSNKYYFDGKEYSYCHLQDFSHLYILDNFSKYCFLSNIDDKHSVFSTFIFFLEKHSFIDSSKDIFFKRIDVLNLLCITPFHNNPSVFIDISNIPVLTLYSFKVNDTVQRKTSALTDISKRTYLDSLKYGSSVSLDIKSLLNHQLGVSIIEFQGDDMILCSYSYDRIRLFKDEVLSENFIVISSEVSNQIIDTHKHSVETCIQSIKENLFVAPNLAYKVYSKYLTNDIIDLIIHTAILDVNNHILSLGNFVSDKDISNAKLEKLNAWKDTFSSYPNIVSLLDNI